MTVLRPDAAIHVLPDRLVVRAPDGTLVELPSPDPRSLLADLRGGDAPPSVVALLRSRQLWGPVDDLLGTSPILPPRVGPVAVVGEGQGAAAARATLQSLGQPSRAAPQGDGGPGILSAGVVLLALDWWDVSRIEAWNGRAHAQAQPWLLACPTEARRILIGPLVVPGQTACHACYLLRRTANAWRPEAFSAQLQDLRMGTTQPPMPPLWLETAGRLGAWEAARFVRGGLPPSLGTAVTLGVDGLDAAHDAVAKAPRCPVCSRHRERPPAEPWIPMPRAEGGAPSRP